MSLVTIREGASHRDRVAFRSDAAASWQRMERENSGPISTNRTTVTHAEQRQQQKETPGLAVDPEHSDHVYKPSTGKGGNAVDTNEWSRLAGLFNRHGWLFLVKGEKWHGVYHLDADQHRIDPTTTDQEEDIMSFIRIQGKAGVRRGGLYAIINGAATFLGDDGGTTLGVVTLTDDGVIGELQKRISGLR